MGDAIPNGIQLTLQLLNTIMIREILVSLFSRELGWLPLQSFTKTLEALFFADLLGLVLVIGASLTTENHEGSPS